MTTAMPIGLTDPDVRPGIVGRGLIPNVTMSHNDVDLIEGSSPQPDLGARWMHDAIDGWVDSTMRPLRRLEPNWDSYGGQPVARFALDASAQFLSGLLHQGVPAPSIVPTGRGGVAFEWHRPGFELNIEMAPDGELVSAYYFDGANESERELDLLSEEALELEIPFGRLLQEEHS